MNSRSVWSRRKKKLSLARWSTIENKKSFLKNSFVRVTYSSPIDFPAYPRERSGAFYFDWFGNKMQYVSAWYLYHNCVYDDLQRRKNIWTKNGLVLSTNRGEKKRVGAWNNWMKSEQKNLDNIRCVGGRRLQKNPFSFTEFLLENCVLKPKEDASKRLQFKMVWNARVWHAWNLSPVFILDPYSSSQLRRLTILTLKKTRL